MKLALFPALLACITLAASHPAIDRDVIVNNDNRRPAGRLERGVLTLRMEARVGTWYAEGPNGTARRVAAFAEEGRAAENPGPLIRVPAGTEVRVNIRNALAEPLTIFGLGETRGLAGGDSVPIEPGASREFRFMATTPGLYWYAGQTTVVPLLYSRRGRDSQLNGVIVVDPPGEGTSHRDRIFLISWSANQDSATEAEDSVGSTMAINGRSWPYTERFSVAQRDSLHWRWVSMTTAPHPMHLHGFYFRVDGKGNGARYTTYGAEERRSAVTEMIRPGETMAIAWSPAKPGNWIFHCHIARHMSPPGEPRSNGRTANGNGGNHANHDAHQHQMAGLVLGIQVKPRGAQPKLARNARSMRLVIRSSAPESGDFVRYSYLLGGSLEESNPSAFPIPGPTLVLRKDEPVAITVVNRSHEAAAVHWHGIELESFPDGVPGWSGSGKELLPAIPPNDSITVRFTPPRTGTFMYHSHFNEMQQIASGLYGAIVVLEPGQTFDPETDRLLLFSDPKPANELTGPMLPLLNGQEHPELQLKAGVTYRFRVINIRSNAPVALSLLDGDTPASWRQVAKDGADLPATQSIMRPAQLILGPGEIYDFAFTPTAAGELKLRIGFPPRPVRQPRVVIPDPRVVPVRVQ